MRADAGEERVFVPNRVDDMNLSPQAFRLYCRLARLGSTTKVMGHAAQCGLSPGEAEGAVVELATNELLDIAPRQD